MHFGISRGFEKYIAGNDNVVADGRYAVLRMPHGLANRSGARLLAKQLNAICYQTFFARQTKYAPIG